MNTPKKPHTPGEDNRFVRSAAWVDRKLTPVFGAPPISPYGEETEQSIAICPVCGHPMSEHVIDHSTPNAILECPAPIDHTLEHESTSPLDEFGMPSRKPKPWPAPATEPEH